MPLEKLRNLARKASIRPIGYEKIAGLLVLGIIIRIIISFFTSHPNDEEVWYVTAVNMLSGQGSPYGTWYFAYPPVWAYIFIPFAKIGSLFSNPYLLATRININGSVIPVLSPIFNFFVKLPIILGDILVGLVIYRFVRDLKDEQSARAAFILWFFNPLVIYTGAVAAQFDVLPALASLLAFVFFLQRKYLLVGVSLGIAIMTKFYPLYFVPLYMVFLFKPVSARKVEWKRGISSLLTLILGIFLAAIIVLLPILATNSFMGFLESIMRARAIVRGTSFVVSLGGVTPLNLITVFGGSLEWINDYGRPQIITTIISSLQILGALLISFYLSFLSKKEITKRYLKGHILILVLVFVTMFTVNTQYIIWILPFLILSYGLYGNFLKRLSILSAAATFIAFYWIYPLYPIIVFVNSSLGIMLHNALDLSKSPFGPPLAGFFGLLGALTLLLLPFETIRIPKGKIFSIKDKDVSR